MLEAAGSINCGRWWFRRGWVDCPISPLVSFLGNEVQELHPKARSLPKVEQDDMFGGGLTYNCHVAEMEAVAILATIVHIRAIDAFP